MCTTYRITYKPWQSAPWCRTEVRAHSIADARQKLIHREPVWTIHTVKPLAKAVSPFENSPA